MCIKIKINFEDEDMIEYMRKNYLNYLFHLDCGSKKEIYLIPEEKAYTDSEIRRKYVNDRH